MGKTNSMPTKSKSKTPIRASSSGKAKSASHKAAGLTKFLKKQRAFGKFCYELSDAFLKQPVEGDPSKRNFQLLNYDQGQAVAASREPRLARTPRNVPNTEEYVPNGDGGRKDKIIANIGLHLDGREGMFCPCISLYIMIYFLINNDGTRTSSYTCSSKRCCTWM